VRLGVIRGPVREGSEATSSRLPGNPGAHALGYRGGVRSVVDFYRARPLVGILVFAVGLAVAIATTSLQDGDGIVLPIAFVAAVGLLVGGVLAVAQRRRRDRS
jgi:hypothetical protein